MGGGGREKHIMVERNKRKDEKEGKQGKEGYVQRWKDKMDEV